MSRTRRFLGGAGFGYANQVIVTVAGLWLTPFLLARMEQHDYGLWLVGTQALAYLMLMDFGVVALLPRETAFASGRAGESGAEGELPLLVGQTARLVLWQTPLVVVAALAFWMLMPSEWEPLKAPLLVVLAAFVLVFPLRIFQAVLLGLQDLEFLGKAQACTWLLSTALTIALVLAGFGLYALAAGWAVAQVLAVPIMLLRLRSRFAGALPQGLPRLPRAEARRKLVNGFWVSINQIGVVLLLGTDVLVIGKMLGPAAVVPYACTAKLIMVLANQPQMLMQLAIPALSELRAGADREHVTRVCVALSQAMLLLSGAVVCVMLVVNRGFVGWWVGAGQYGGFALTALVSLAMILRHWNLTVGIILFSFGRERRLAVTGLLDGIVTVGASIVFTNWWGLAGAPLGAILGVCLVSLPGNLWALAGANATPVAMLLRSLAPWFWRFALLALAAGVFAQRFVPDTFPSLASAAVLTASVYCAVMLPLILREPLGIYVRPRLSPLGVRFFRALRLTKPA
ncbi:MAG: oligosaccharide flippase family protein [Rubrivivax sp.]|nr:oligosaccharide flippase family protein [Pyrinomonadaceae bacterium]